MRFIGTGSTGLSTIEEWRKLLGATAKTYDVYKRFKDAVLNPAIKEVNALTNIHIALKIQKTGRRITHIGFDVIENKQESIPFFNGMEDIKNSTQYKTLKKYKIEEVKAITLIQEYGYKYISEKIKLTEEQHNLRKPSGFLLDSIEQDWKDSKQALKKSVQKKEQEKRNLEKKNRLIEQKKSEEVNKVKKEKKKKIEEYLSLLDSETLKNINEKFIDKHKGTIHIGKHLKNGEIDLTNSVVKIK